MWSVHEGPRQQHEDDGVVHWGFQAPSAMPRLDPAACITGHVGAAANPAALPLPALKPALKRGSSSPKRQQQMVHFTPRSSEAPDNLPITPNTNWSTWASPSYSSPSYQDPNHHSHSSYTISQPQIHSNSNNSGAYNPSGSNGSYQQQSYHHEQQPLTMPLNFNPQTPPQQTAGYHPTPSPPMTTPPQQQQQYPTQYPLYRLPQSNMVPSRRAPAPPTQYYPVNPPLMMPPPQQQNMMPMRTDPMQDWYNNIPEPKMGPFQPPIPLMRGTQFMPGLSSMHPVSCFLVFLSFLHLLSNIHILDILRPSRFTHQDKILWDVSPCPFTHLSPHPSLQYSHTIILKKDVPQLFHTEMKLKDKEIHI